MPSISSAEPIGATAAGPIQVIALGYVPLGLFAGTELLQVTVVRSNAATSLPVTSDAVGYHGDGKGATNGFERFTCTNKCLTIPVASFDLPLWIVLLLIVVCDLTT